MGALMLAAALLLTDPVSQWQPLVDAAATRCGVPADWISRVMRVESRGIATARSPKGAMGLMQLMPATWQQMRTALVLGEDPDDPGDNILAGACYLRRMYDSFGYPGLFGAYNAGPARYAAWLSGRRALPPETIAYFQAIGTPAPSPAVIPEAAPALFAVRLDGAGSAASPATSASGLFAIRKQIP